MPKIAVRRLLRSPLLTAAIVGAIAVSVSLFVLALSISDRILFRPLPFRDGGRLVRIDLGINVAGRSLFRPAFTTAIREHATAFDAVAVAGSVPLSRVLPDCGPTPASFQPVSANLLQTLGVVPVVGRDFVNHDVRGDREVVLITHALWSRCFARSLAILNRVAAGPTIVGVLPESFLPPVEYIASRTDGIIVAADRLLDSPPIARLAPGTAIDAARAQVATMLSRNALGVTPDYPVEFLRIDWLGHIMFREVRPYTLLALFASALVIFLGVTTACGLMILRIRTLARDTAIRIALGASIADVFRLALIECLLVFLLGTAVGVSSALGLTSVLSAVTPGSLGAFAVAPTDPRVLWAACGLGFLALLASASVLWLDLRRGGRDCVTGARRNPRTSSLVLSALRLSPIIGQLTLGTALVGTAVIAIEGVRALRWSRGYDYSNLFTVTVMIGDEFPIELKRQFVRDALSQTPGVISAGIASSLPYQSGTTKRTLLANGTPGVVWGVGTDFLETIGAELLAGRNFGDGELDGTSGLAIINERAAAGLFSGQTLSQVRGQTVVTPLGPRTVIGVLADIKPELEATTAPGMFVPLADPLAEAAGSVIYVAVRAAAGNLDNQSLKGNLARLVRDSSVLATPVAPAIVPRVAQLRFVSALVSIIGLAAVAVSLLGVTATIVSEVTSRRREISIRLMLGADLMRLVKLTVAPQLVAVLTAGAIGVLGGMRLAEWCAKGAPSSDRDPWVTFVAVWLFLSAVALATILTILHRSIRSLRQPMLLYRASMVDP